MILNHCLKIAQASDINCWERVFNVHSDMQFLCAIWASEYQYATGCTSVSVMLYKQIFCSLIWCSILQNYYSFARCGIKDSISLLCLHTWASETTDHIWAVSEMAYQIELVFGTGVTLSIAMLYSRGLPKLCFSWCYPKRWTLQPCNCQNFLNARISFGLLEISEFSECLPEKFMLLGISCIEKDEQWWICCCC